MNCIKPGLLAIQQNPDIWLRDDVYRTRILFEIKTVWTGAGWLKDPRLSEAGELNARPPECLDNGQPGSYAFGLVSINALVVRWADSWVVGNSETIPSQFHINPGFEVAEEATKLVSAFENGVQNLGNGAE